MNNGIDFYIDTEFDNINDFDCGFNIFNDYLKKRIPKDNAVLMYKSWFSDGCIAMYKPSR